MIMLCFGVVVADDLTFLLVQGAQTIGGTNNSSMGIWTQPLEEF